jgi:hypothetical protein
MAIGWRAAELILEDARLGATARTDSGADLNTSRRAAS